MRFLIGFLKIIIPISVVAVSLVIGQQIIANKPEPKRRSPPPVLAAVDASRLAAQSYQIRVKTQGTVRPRTESTLLPQVAGRIVNISANFREGGFFEQGEHLLTIDPRDYEIAVTIAEAQVAQANAALEEEIAQAEVAEREWQQLKRKPASSRLALRKPQLAAARATVASAEAQLARAQLDLERTRISAPYEGRVLEQNVDIGQYVSPGTVLGKVYAVDYVEIRLPLSAEQLKYVHIPEEFRDESKDHPPGPAVTLTTRVANDAYQWQGTIVRAAAAVDTKSRQLFVVAQVDDPYAKSAVTRAPLRIGQFVEAEIAGALLHDVIVIPRAALRSGDSVFIVDDLGQIYRRDLTLVWRDQNSAVVKTGVTAGEALVLTPLTGAGDGMRVAATIDGVAPAPSGKGRGQDDKRLVSRGGQAMKKTRLDE